MPNRTIKPNAMKAMAKMDWTAESMSMAWLFGPTSNGERH
jgi:hypothetical protein